MSDKVSRHDIHPTSTAEQRQRARREQNGDGAKHGTRREFIGVGAAAAALAVAGPTGPALAKERPAGTSDRSQASATSYDEGFRRRAVELRQKLARDVASTPIPPHPHNGDQQRYPNAIGSDTRGLPHDERGEVNAEAWRLANVAFSTRSPADFEKIPLGGARKLVNPVGTLAVSLDGLNASQFQLPAAPALASPARAADAVEIYWQSLLRDVPFTEYNEETSNPDIRAAVDELNRIAAFQGPKANGRVTPQTLFRGSVTYVDSADPSGATPRWVTPPGVIEGPLVSQFLYRDVPLGNQSLSAKIRAYAPTPDFLTKYDEWLHVQNGNAPRERITYESAPRYISNGRDLGAYAHTAQAFNFVANQLLSAPEFAADPAYGGIYPANKPATASADPYLRSKTQGGASGTFGAAYYQSVIALASSLAIRINYYQKWYEQRIVRPEAFSGLVHQRLANKISDYPIHDSLLGSQALERSRTRNGTFLLGHIFPEGAPLHSSYPGGAAIIAAVTVTLLKAFYDESREFPNPVQPDPKDPTRLIPYRGPPLTVGGELNKLALNYSGGRTWGGIHWRSDAAASFPQGENLAISLLREQKATFAEPFDGFSFTRFDGSKVTV
jgi:hypothetical protein